ncbi:division/cell wall cluster transcriptional repressor MraZ [Methylophilaceae bacterium]|jgi:MraZ protein|nr:division/cell wall cluster transcriptional repressor MraZ [Methylophilaceae bacterium]|tara:strand:- start:764 stop:1201 length:438 start_codon:yes stop_codon:yes gene_type:complete
MFKGATLLNIDGKNRLAIPTKYREELLTGSLVLTAHPHGCLLLYPIAAWRPIQEKIMQLSSFDKKSSGLQRLLVGYAEDLSSDNAGRLLISSALRDYASIDKSLMFVGQGSHFELWSKENWTKQIKQIKINDKGELPDELGGFSL